MNQQQIAYTCVGTLVGITIGFICGWLIGRRSPSASKGTNKSEPGVELFVGNLPYELSEQKLQELFSKYGRVLSVRIITNKYRGKSKGYGFVLMAERNSAENAVRQLNGQEILGRTIVVNEAKSRPR